MRELLCVQGRSCCAGMIQQVWELRKYLFNVGVATSPHRITPCPAPGSVDGMWCEKEYCVDYSFLNMCTGEPHIWCYTVCQCQVWWPDGIHSRYWLWKQKHGTAFTSLLICAKIETMSSPTGTGGAVGSGGQPDSRKQEKKAREYRKGKKMQLIKRNW